MPPIVKALTGLRRSREEPHTIGHDCVLAPLPCDPEPGLLERPNGVQVIYTGQLRHRLNRDVDFSDFLALQRFLYRREVLANGILDILQSLVLRLALRPATRKAWASDAEALFATLNGDLVPHGAILPPANALISRPNGQRISGERRAEGDERVRCMRVLGGTRIASNVRIASVPLALLTLAGAPRATASRRNAVTRARVIIENPLLDRGRIELPGVRVADLERRSPAGVARPGRD